MMLSRMYLIVGIFLWVLVSASVALAQDAPRERAFEDLFGSRRVNPSSRQDLQLTLSLYGGYDGNLSQRRDFVVADPRTQASASFSGSQGQIRYQARGDRLSFGATGWTTARYYPRLDLASSQHDAQIDLTATLGRTTLRLGQTANYSPYYLLPLFPTTVVADESASQPGVDRTISSRKWLAYATSAAVTQKLGARSTLGVTLDIRHAGLLHEREDDLTDRRLAARFTYRMTKYASLRATYGNREARYGSRGAATGIRGPDHGHDVDLGVDYGLSSSRRITVGFSSGSTILTGAFRTSYRTQGSANLNVGIGRHGSTRLSYRRGLEYVEGFVEPFFSDTVTGRINGYFGRRVAIQGSAGYTIGEVGLVQTPHAYESYLASAGVTVAVTRHWALFVEDFYARYRFDDDVLLPPGMLGRLDRLGARLGLTLWIPFLR